MLNRKSRRGRTEEATEAPRTNDLKWRSRLEKARRRKYIFCAAFLNGKRGGTFTEVCGQETWEREEMEAEEENKKRGSARLAQAEKSKRRSSKWKRSWWKIAGLQ
jgi:hypothetical protein